MAFRFNWPEFDTDFYKEATSQLEAALNKGNKPKNIVDHISVTELNMGTTAPELEILEIGELSTDKFRGIFKLTYAGDAYIVIQTKVQANPMHAKESDLPRHTRPSVLAADQPLVVPMLLRISDLKLRGIVVLVVSKTKGITLVFKNDPLESIIVSSTFDSVTSVRSFLQREIENQLRNLFQEDLPIMIHNLSKRHIQSQQEKEEEQIKQERVARSVFSDPGIQTTLSSPIDTLSMPDLSRYQSTSFSSFSDLEFLNHDATVPVTAENLSALNALYASRFAALKSPPYSEFEHVVQEEEEEEDENNDVPWYVRELPSTETFEDSFTMMDKDIVLNPKENSIAAKLAQLATVNHTISPFAHTINHFTFRSLPHTVKIDSKTRHKKTSKRRIIRWNSTI